MTELRHNAIDFWIPLMDYAIKKGVSLSTLRRHIKANKVTYKVENGRYLLWDNDSDELVQQSLPQISTEKNGLIENELRQITIELRKAQEEIAELKTLIALYEENIPAYRLDN